MTSPKYLKPIEIFAMTVVYVRLFPAILINTT